MRPPFLPVLSGLLLALSFPPFPLGLVVFVALVPFAVWVFECTPDRSGTVEAMRGGLWMGLAFFGVLLHWIAFSLPDRPLLGAASFVTVVAILALFPAMVARIIRLGVERGVPLWLTLPVAWTAAEWLRGALPGGFAFPWAGLALSLASIPRVVGPVAWVGEHGVAFWIAVVNGLVASAVLRARSGGTRDLAWPALAAVAVAVLPPLLFAGGDLVAGPRGARADGSQGRELRVALVQTAVPQNVREDPDAGARAMATALDRLLPRVAPGSADLIVLPETAFPVALESPTGRVYLEQLQAHARSLDATIVVGAFGTEPSASAGRRAAVFNSVFVVGADGLLGRYDKRHLVPGVERTPLIPAALLPLLGDTASYSLGQPTLLTVTGPSGEVRIGPLVCYESAFAGLARTHVRAGAQVLVNVTNDAWFGSGPPGVVARAQHEAHLVLRAIESRIPVMRSANGGVGMVVEPTGIVRAVARAGEEAVGVEGVKLADAAGPRLWLAGLMGPLSAVGALLIVWLAGGVRLSPLRARRSGAPKSFG